MDRVVGSDMLVGVVRVVEVASVTSGMAEKERAGKRRVMDLMAAWAM